MGADRPHVYSPRVPLPAISEADIRALIPGVTDVTPAGRGGQKVVYRVDQGQRTFALKFALLPDTFQAEDADLDETVLRARRETQIMAECQSPHIVKLGPVELGITTIGGQNVLYFSEEFIDGESLKDVIHLGGAMPTESVVRLGLQISSAIEELWLVGKIHRDIKPGNIMRRADGNYVLLDAGLAFDIAGDSISAGLLVGTMAYFSPEQFDYTNRRVLDFRSDIFSLGVSLYEASTGRHPFLSPTTSTPHLFTKITKYAPVAPSSLNPAVPPELDAVILRMMGKSPHLRYRRMSQLIDSLNLIQGNQQ